MQVVLRSAAANASVAAGSPSGTLSHGCAMRTILDGFGPSNPSTPSCWAYTQDWQVLLPFRGVPGLGLVRSLPL